MGMTTKAYLGQLKRLDMMINNKLNEIYQLKLMATSISAQPNDIRVQTSGDKDIVGATIAKIVDEEREVDRMVDELVEKRKHIIRQIDSLGDTDMYNLLSMKYVARKDWKEIEVSMRKSHRYIVDLHTKALVEFERRFGKEYL